MLSIGRLWEEPGVSQDYVVELVQDEQEKVSVIPAVFVQKSLVEQQPGSHAALDAGGFRHIAELDIEQSEELLHLIARGRQYIEDAFTDGRCLRCGWTVEEDIHGKRALTAGSSKAIGSESSLSQLRSRLRRERRDFPSSELAPRQQLADRDRGRSRGSRCRLASR